MSTRPRLSTIMAVTLMLLGAGFAHASTASFEISAEGVKLGPADETEEIPRYRVQLKQGQSATFIAQGIVSPRGGKNQPSEPDAAAWLFEDSALQLVPNEQKFDKTKFAVTLKGLKSGETRVRFVGNILGYERKYDIMVDVAKAP